MTAEPLSKRNGRVQGIMEIEDGPLWVGSQGKGEKVENESTDSRHSLTCRVEYWKTPLKTAASHKFFSKNGQRL